MGKERCIQTKRSFMQKAGSFLGFKEDITKEDIQKMVQEELEAVQLKTNAKIVQGINQAAANAYDGSHDERYTHDGKARAMGLKREEGDPILDSRVIDGFKVKFSGDAMCINYQSEVKLKEVYAGGFEDEMARRINEIKKFLKKNTKPSQENQ